MRNMLRAPDAHVYICGDSLMANAVTASLTQIMGAGPLTQAAAGVLHSSMATPAQEAAMGTDMSTKPGQVASQPSAGCSHDILVQELLVANALAGCFA